MLASRAALRTWDAILLAIAAGVLAHLYYRNILVTSHVIDNTRYHLLDDDMMISMRYGRNLAEGHGLVWNEGEHVEGYTNFLWTIVMAGVHLTGIADKNAALGVRFVTFVFTVGGFHVAMRMARLFAPRSIIVTPVLLALLVQCPDVVLWAVWGFETALLNILNITFLYTLFRSQKRGVPMSKIGWAALALVPLTRGDGVYIFAANAVIAILVTRSSRHFGLVKGFAIALLPWAIHLLFRRVYYDDWLPNTYWLKVYGLERKHLRGWIYARHFLVTYGVILSFAAGGGLSIMGRDRRSIALFATGFATVFYVTLIGGDMLGPFRFFAHLVPLVFVFASIGVVTVFRHPVGRTIWLGGVVYTQLHFTRPFEHLIGPGTNGDPHDQIQVAMLVKKNALPSSSIAVIAAGIVPYFTRLRAIDILGKNDKHIAKMLPFPGAMVGHGKLDPPYTLLEKKPDLVVSCRNLYWTRGLTRGTRNHDPVLSFLASTAFKDTYEPNFVNEPFLIHRTTLFTYKDSAEYPKRNWSSVTRQTP